MWQMLSRAARVFAMGAVFACSGRSHPQQEGRYAVSLQQVLRDDCGLAGEPSQFQAGMFSTAGDDVRFVYDLYSMPMVGSYEDVEEHFYLDGSVANVQSQLPDGTACLDDLVSLHIDGSTVNAQEFDGTLRFSYQSTNAACTCDLWTSYRAVKQ